MTEREGEKKIDSDGFFPAGRRQEEKYALTRTLMYVCSGYDAHTVHVRTKGGNRECVWSGEREELRGRSQKSSIVVERSSFASKPEIEEEEEERILPWWLLPSLPLQRRKERNRR